MFFDKDPWMKNIFENPNKIGKITTEIFSYYLPFKNCLTCELTRSPIIPDCYRDCKLKVKPSTEDTCKPLVETRTKVDDQKYAIQLTRSELVWNYYNDYDFIFRGRRKYNLILHHKNLVPLDDRFENLCLLVDTEHDELHKQIDMLKRDIEISKMNRNFTLLKAQREQYRQYLNICNSVKIEDFIKI